MHYTAKKKGGQKWFNCSSFYEKTTKKRALNTYPHPGARLSVHLSSVCVTTETSDNSSKTHVQRGAVRFSLFCLWACLARFLDLHQPANSFWSRWMTKTSISAGTLCGIDTLPSPAPYSVITRFLSLLTAPPAEEAFTGKNDWKFHWMRGRTLGLPQDSWVRFVHTFETNKGTFESDSLTFWISQNFFLRISFGAFCLCVTNIFTYVTQMAELFCCGLR